MTKRSWLSLLGALMLCTAPAAAAAYDATPWLADLAQARQAFETRYANFDWLTRTRGLDLEALFADSAMRLRAAGSDADARAVFDRIVRRIGDGHVEIDWPAPATAAAGPAPDRCSSLGYDARQDSPGVSANLASYHALGNGGGNVFTAGTAMAGARRVGIVRIGVFQPQGFPSLCEAAIKALSIPPGGPCDDKCENAILTWSYRRLTADLTDRLRAVANAGAGVLLIDLTGNGGGSEWVEAVARMISGKRLVSERLGFVRGAQWTREWGDTASQLRAALATAPRADRPRLRAWIAEAEAAQVEAARTCRDEARCDRIGRAGYATGLVGSAPAGSFADKPWGQIVFSSAQYNYRDAIWSGPLIILVDQETWSAAEELAAVIQDNRAGVVMGERTGGAGCGHTDGSAPIILAHSNGRLQLPDCVRFRADGSNEVNGVVPDVVVATRVSDGARFKAGLIEASLAAAVDQAIALNAAR